MLPELQLTLLAGECTAGVGLDTYEQCLDKEYFEKYPYSVFYFFNQRGFRDNEWPDNIEKKIWCVGDSFTVGLGQPFEHIWPQQIDNSLNVSMNGASNDWISRKALYIIQNANPNAVLIQWSYLHRRENLDHTLPDEMRMMQQDPSDVNDVENFLKNIKLVESNKGSIPVVHSFIPKFYNLEKDSNENVTIYAELDKLGAVYFPNITPIDLARDGHHYGKETALLYANKYLDLLEKIKYN
jgi:hypothetical protein